MTSTLVIGVDSAELPVVLPTPLAGFAARAVEGATDLVLAPLRLRTLALDTDHDHPLVLISADLLFWGDDLVDVIKDRFQREYGIDRHHLVLHATHTHSGPQASHRFIDALGVPDDHFLSGLVDATLATAGRALAGRRTVTVERASIPVPLGVDRRHARTGDAHPPISIDQEATVLRFRNLSGQCVALLVQHACHPVLHHGNAVTSDFTGAAMTALEADDAEVALYLQGCCGDVNPDRYEGTAFIPGGQPEVDAFGRTLSAAVSRLLRTGTWRPERPMVDVGERAFAVPVAKRPTLGELRMLSDRTDSTGEWARLLLEEPARLAAPVLVRLTRMRVTEQTRFLGFSAELVTRYGRYAKHRSGSGAIALGYTNGMTGYLVTARQLAEGGYEPAEAPYYFGMPGPLDPSVEDAVMAEIDHELA